MSKKTKNEADSKKISNLRQKESLEILIDYHPNPMALALTDGTIVDANKQFASIFQKTRKELIGVSGFDLLAPDTGDRRTVFVNELINKKKTVVFEDHDLNHYWKTILKPVINESGKVDKIAVYLYDLTEEKKEEEKKLELKEKFYHRLIRNSSDIFLIMEKNGTIRFISQSAKSILGYSRDELERKTIFSFIHPDDINVFQHYFDQLIQTKKPLRPIEMKMKSKKDQYVYVESVGNNLLSDSQINGIVMTIRDISERKKAKEQLDQSEKKFKSIISSMSEVIFLLNSRDSFVDAHVPPNFPLYMAKEDFIDKSIEEILPDNVVNSYKQAAQQVRATKKPRTIEYYLLVHGETRWFLATLDLYVDDKSIIVSIIDITDRKNIEEDFRESDRLLRAIFNDPETFIGILDCEGILLKANETSLQFIDASRASVEGKKFWKTPWWAHSKRLQRKLQTAIIQAKNGKVQRFEATHTGKNNEEITVLFSLRPVENDEKQIVSLVAEGYEITPLKKAIHETNIMKNYLQDAINSTLELVIITDIDTKITFWNDRAEELTNRSKKDVFGKKLSSLSVFSNHSEIIQSLQRCDQEGSNTFDLIIRPKQKEKKLIRVVGSAIVNEKNKKIGLILIGRDITHESNIHGRLISGKSYLIADETNEQSFIVFSNLIQTGHEGMIFTRDAVDFRKKSDTLDHTQIVYFDDSSSKRPSAQHPEAVIDMVKSFVSSEKKSVILIDRLDYLLTLFSFEAIMKMIYRLNHLISSHQVYLFIRVNPSILSVNQYRLLKEELEMIPRQQSIDSSLDKKLYDLLEFIHQQNKQNMLVSFKLIGKHFSITKVTTAKRVKQLSERGLIVVRRRGRVKTSHITEAGKRLLQKRSAI